MNPSAPGAVRLTVSIVLHNSDPRLLGATLNSLREAALCAADDGELAVMDLYLVDNDSGDACRSTARQLADAWVAPPSGALHWLQAPANRGFGAGNNLALQRGVGDVHLVLNPDVELDRRALSVGLERLRREPEEVLISPWVSGAGGEQEFLCKAYPSLWVLFLRGFAPAFLRGLFRGRIERYEMRRECSTGEPCEVTLASGCCMLLRGDALQQVGGFDEDFFLYFEDFDLSLRLARHGRLRFLPRMRIVHHGGYAARKGWGHVKMFLGSARRFFARHGWRWI